MNVATRVCLALAVVLSVSVTGGCGFTDSNLDPHVRLQGMLSMMGIACSPEVVRDCTVQADKDSFLLHMMQMVNALLPCMRDAMNTTNLQSDFQQAKASNQYRPAVQRFCTMASRTVECTKISLRKSKNCVCELELEALMMTPQTLDQQLESLCKDRGERLVTFLESGGLEFWIDTHKNDTEGCGEIASIRHVFQNKDELSLGLPHYLEKRYNQTLSFKECLVGIGEGHTSTMDYVRHLMDSFLNSMRCVNGTDLEDLVPCNDLNH